MIKAVRESVGDHYKLFFSLLRCFVVITTLAMDGVFQNSAPKFVLS